MSLFYNHYKYILFTQRNVFILHLLKSFNLQFVHNSKVNVKYKKAVSARHSSCLLLLLQSIHILKMLKNIELKLNYWMCKFPKSPIVRLLVGWMVCRLSFIIF